MSSGTSDHNLVLIETFQKFLSSTFQYLNHLEYKPITPGYIPPFLGSLLRPSLKSKTQNSVLRILIRVDQTLLKILKNSYFFDFLRDRNRGVTWRDPVPLLLQIYVGKNAYRTPLGLAPSKTTHDSKAANKTNNIETKQNQKHKTITQKQKHMPLYHVLSPSKYTLAPSPRVMISTVKGKTVANCGNSALCRQECVSRATTCIEEIEEIE